MAAYSYKGVEYEFVDTQVELLEEHDPVTTFIQLYV